MATADFADWIRGLIVLLFIFGPTVARVLKRGEKERNESAPPRKRPRPAPPQPSEGTALGTPPETVGDPTVTWKDLLEGRVPNPPTPAPVPEPVVEPWELETQEVAAEASAEERWGKDPFAFESEDLVPDDQLPPAPPEEWLERQDDAAEAANQSFIDALELKTSADEDSMGVQETRRANRRRFVRGRADLRRAIVLSEVLGRPLAIRSEQNYPGPPSLRR